MRYSTAPADSARTTAPSRLRRAVGAALAALLALAPLLALPLVSAWPGSASAGAFEKRQLRYPRYRAAASEDAAEVERRFRDAGAAWPPRLFLRAFKLEGLLEMWAAPATGDRWIKVRSFPICAASGGLGPKRQQGDRQVPEGFYRVERFNPASRFHLSLGIDYPNALDRTRTPPGRSPGGDIFIHGDCVTIGCLPLRDEPMEALYVATVAAWDAGHRGTPVHIFPCRFGTARCEAALTAAGAERPTDAATWPGLRPGFALFEEHRVPPRIRVDRAGYRIRPPVRRGGPGR